MRRLSHRNVSITGSSSSRVVRVIALGVGALIGGIIMIGMPGRSYRGSLPPLTSKEQGLREFLRRDVAYLSGTIGESNVEHYANLKAAAEFIARSWTEAGYVVERQGYDGHGKRCENLQVELAGHKRRDEIVIVGAHYDSVIGSPGANDNATGVAALLALAGAVKDSSPSRTLRFVAFVNEEPVWFQTEAMGSVVYATRARSRAERIVAMISLETIGYYSDAPNSQQFPSLFLKFFYPSTGNFIAFVSNLSSQRLLRRAIGSFRRHARFPSEGLAAPEFIPGVGWSDHWAFWRAGYPALMVTDTAPLRYPYYHTAEDTADKIDYDRLSRVISGIQRMIEEWVENTTSRAQGLSARRADNGNIPR